VKERIKREKRYRRHKRVRAKIYGTSKVPRLCVFRSNKHIYAQLVDDENGKTIATANDQKLKLKSKKEKSASVKATASKEKKIARKVAIAYEVGKLIAEKALKNKIEKVIFDRGGYKYHGRVKAVAEGARKGGLKF